MTDRETASSGNREEIRGQVNEILDGVRDTLVKGILETGPIFPESKFFTREEFEEILKGVVDTRLAEMMVTIILNDLPSIILGKIKEARDGA